MDCIVFGAGKIGQLFAEFLEEQDKEIEFCFCDNHRTVDIIREKKVLSFEDSLKEKTVYVVAVGPAYADEIAQQLTDYNQKFYSIVEFIEVNWGEEFRRVLTLWLRVKNANKLTATKIVNSKVISGGALSIEPRKYEEGVCQFCGKKTAFVTWSEFLHRENYSCIYCGLGPRKRALFKYLHEREEELKKAIVHESSPGKTDAVSKYIRSIAKDYTFSYYMEDRRYGEDLGEGCTCQNLEEMTFDDESFDILITQDVMEHVNYPEKAFREIARVLKKGGKHIFTVPMRLEGNTIPRIKMVDGKRISIIEEIWHGDPTQETGCLMTYSWGDDMPKFIDEQAATKTEIIEFPRYEAEDEKGFNVPDIRVIVTTKLM